MTPADQARFPAVSVELKNGTNGMLRLLRTNDGDRLGNFYESLDSEAHRYYWPHSLDREHGPTNAAKADSSTGVVLVLEMPDHTIGGYAWYRWPNDNAESSGFGICVANTCRGCGAGRLLMTRLLEIADAGIGPRVMRLTCQHANAKAVELYQKMGFKIVKEGICGERRGFPAEPQYWMERSCGDHPKEQ